MREGRPCSRWAAGWAEPRRLGQGVAQQSSQQTPHACAWRRGVAFEAARGSSRCVRRRRCLAVGGDAVISKSVRGLRPPDAGALLVAAVARLQARALRLTSPLLWCSCSSSRWRGVQVTPRAMATPL
jgi:hypothetical protein